MGNGKGEYEQRSCGAVCEGILSMHKKGCKPGLVSAFSIASWMNKQHEDIVKSTSGSPFVYTKSYQG